MGHGHRLRYTDGTSSPGHISPAAGVQLAKRGRAMTDLNGELIRLIEQNHREDGVVATAIPRLHLVRFSRPTERIPGFYEPAFCIVAQGRKRAMRSDGHTSDPQSPIPI